MKIFNNSLKRFLFRGLVVILFFATGAAYSQGSSTYVNPTASASGMTSGLENGSTSGTMNMMQVRAAAQQSERQAAAAAMARSAEKAIEDQGLKTALEKARRTRRAKIEASERLKWQKVSAYNAYNRVSGAEMATWKDQNGNIKVGRGLPSDFVNSVKADEAARAAQNTQQKKGFTPLKSISEKVVQATGIEEPISHTGLSGPKPLPPATLDDGRKGPFGLKIPKIKAPKLPFIGNRKSAQPAPAPPTAPPARYAAAPPQQPRPAAPPAPKPAPASATSSTPSTPVRIQQTRSATGATPTQSQNQNVVSNTTSAIGNTFKKAGSLFSRNKKQSSPKPASTKKFSFGNKKPAAPSPVVSSSLFPTGAVPSAPVPAAATSAPAPAPAAPAPTANRTIVSLPGSTAPAPKKKKFSLPVPKLSVPKFSGPKSNSSGVSPTSTMNSNGNNFYIVEAASQFMVYGESRTDTKISAVRPGTLVRMTKPGNDWATVQLQNGKTGIIQTKNLRGATSAQVPSGFGSR